MADDENGPVPDEDGQTDPDQRQDQLVERLRPDPALPPVRTLTFSGFAGRSDRRGYRRLYLSRTLDHYIEVRAEDVVEEERIAAADPPLVGHEATRLYVRRDATIDQVRSRPAEAVDEFDLDFRPGGTSAPGLLPNPTWGGGCTWGTDCGGGGTNFGLSCPGSCGDTCQITICRGATCIDVCETRRHTWCEQDTCVTCGQGTCRTCDQGTCQTCGTCQTQCGQGTCRTCHQATCATCNDVTCQTCVTDCPRRTCITCDTCNPHVFTCGTRC